MAATPHHSDVDESKLGCVIMGSIGPKHLQRNNIENNVGLKYNPK